MIGETLSHYKILDKLGAGGMGEVYLAEDTTLKRHVALKVLPPDLAASQERLERFQREAESLAALNHPNIVHVYSVEEDEGTHFITMELVEGEPLSQLIPKGGLPLEQIFELAIPLADALATAHEKGVIHRDLKPANIMVTDEGRVKVLDFGLAKLCQEAETPLATELPTEPLTEEGRIVGTMPYMSPEQLEGKEIDTRSDIFSLGVVLYEMTTGERPFKGDTSVSLISSIVKDDPRPVDAVNEDLPHHLARIIRHCLEKEPKRRYQSALDVSNELEDLKVESASGEVSRKAAPAPKRRNAMLWAGIAAAGIVLVAAIAVLVWVLLSGQERAEDGSAPSTATFTKLVFDASQKGKVSASPDGRFFAYASDTSGNWDIYLRRIAGGNAINLTEDSPADDSQPAFSSDGESIAFHSERDGGGIYVMGATGESVRRVADHGFFPNWSPDGSKIVFSTVGGVGGRLVAHRGARIWVVDLSSGDLQMLLDRSGLMPAWSPNGLHVAYFGAWEPSESETQYDLFSVPIDGGEPVRLTNDYNFETSPAWSPDGYSLYYVGDRGGPLDLWKLPIDPKTGNVRGDPEPVTSGSGVGFASPSGTGMRVLYSSSTRSLDIQRVPFDPNGEAIVGPPVSLTPPGLQASNPSVSPDGEWIAFNAEFGNPGSRAIGIVRTDGSGLRQLTDSGYRDLYPRWSPDGRRLTFYGNRSGNSQAWIINADGSELKQLTDSPPLQVMPPVWSPNGSQLAVASLDCKVTYIFQADKTWSEEEPSQLSVYTEADGTFCPWSWSPDGRLLAGHHWRDEGIAVFSFDSRSYKVLALEWGWPMWLADSRRIFFVSADETTDSVFSILDTETGDHHEVLSSEILSFGPDTLRLGAAISPDNRSIYFVRTHTETGIWMLTLGDQE